MPESQGLRALSQELEHNRAPRPAERLKNGSAAASGEGRSKPRASELSLDPALEMFGPPTDAALDARHEHDHLTQWYARRPGDKRVGYALLVFALGLATAAAAFGWWPFTA